MFKQLKALLGQKSDMALAMKPPVRVKAAPKPLARDFRAVSLAPSERCCGAANAAAGNRRLLRDAPRLPLADCTMPADCCCKFRKTADRRDSDRRLLGGTETNRWFAGPDLRQRGSRRAIPI
jgi:hypothetical protein